MGSADTEMVVFVSRYQTELHCLCKLAEWDGAAGNGAGFSVRGRRKDHMSRELISLALWPFLLFKVMLQTIKVRFSEGGVLKMVRIGRDLLGGLRRQLLSFLFPSPQEKWQFQEHLDFF